MQVNVSSASVADLEVDGLIVGIAEGATTPSGALADLDSAVQGVIADVLAEAKFAGKDGQVELLYPLRGAKARRLALVGLGKEALTPESWRKAVAAGMDALSDKTKHVGIVLPAGLDVAAATSATVEAAQLSAYTFHPYRSKPDEDECLLEAVTVHHGDAEAAASAKAMADAVCWVRDMSNMPGNKLNVPELAKRAAAFATEGGLSVRRFDHDELVREGFGCLVAVGRGSVDPAVFLVVEYKGGKPDEAPIALVGKGITYDTGGVCIKPRAGMEEMKTDMHGAATVLATLRVAAGRKLPVNLVALLPIAENMPNGNAYLPGDVLKSYNGLTVEVSDTDAEGRLILADGIGYAVKNFKPRTIIDVATLTGSIIMALGYEASGLFSNNDTLVGQLLAAGTRTGERLWRMPSWDSYNEALRSDIADIRHIGRTKGADATNAAKFLERFVDKTPWAHIDIAGPSFLQEQKHYNTKGSTGVGVRLLVDWLESAL